MRFLRVICAVMLALAVFSSAGCCGSKDTKTGTHRSSHHHHDLFD